MFLYADSAEAAEHAREAVTQAMAAHAIAGEASSVMRWHPLEERWEDARRRCPPPRPARAAERTRLRGSSDAESAAGRPRRSGRCASRCRPTTTRAPSPSACAARGSRRSAALASPDRRGQRRGRTPPRLADAPAHGGARGQRDRSARATALECWQRLHPLRRLTAWRSSPTDLHSDSADVSVPTIWQSRTRFEPAEVEPRIIERWLAERALSPRARGRGRRELLDRDPAAERHRLACTWAMR